VGLFTWGLISPHFQAGKVRLLLTSKKIPEFPNIPTITELGYKQELPASWFAMYGPVGMPEEVKNEWQRIGPLPRDQKRRENESETFEPP
jgi:tripartite-type tricarboxylate transporter receptor subunit TctC